jgi:hypothetical protein
MIGLPSRPGTAVLPICSIPGTASDRRASRRRAASATNQSRHDGSADATAIGSSRVADATLPRRFSNDWNARCAEASSPDRRSGSLSAATAGGDFIRPPRRTRLASLGSAPHLGDPQSRFCKLGPSNAAEHPALDERFFAAPLRRLRPMECAPCAMRATNKRGGERIAATPHYLRRQSQNQRPA